MNSRPQPPAQDQPAPTSHGTQESFGEYLKQSSQALLIALAFAAVIVMWLVVKSGNLGTASNDGGPIGTAGGFSSVAATSDSTAAENTPSDPAASQSLASQSSVTQSKNSRSANPDATTSAAAAATVSLTIEYHPGSTRQFAALPWESGWTVFDALQAAANDSPRLEIESVGQGATRLIKSIQGIENEGGSGLNWVFHVNGRLGDKSSGVFEVAPGDAILWKFDEYK